MCITYFLWITAKVFQSYAPFEKLLYILISCDKAGLGYILIMISDRSSFGLNALTFSNYPRFFPYMK